MKKFNQNIFNEVREIMKKPKIIHVMANGKHVNSIEGHVIPDNNPVYQVIFAGHNKEREREECKKDIV